MTTLPTWAVYAVSLGTPVVTFLGVLLAQFLSRRGAKELETRSRREETMRNLRWAAELSVSRDDRLADLGVSQLETLLTSDLLDEAEKVFVEAALDTVYEEPEAELDQLGEDAEAVQFRDDSAATPTAQDAVDSQPRPDGGGADG